MTVLYFLHQKAQAYKSVINKSALNMKNDRDISCLHFIQLILNGEFGAVTDF